MGGPQRVSRQLIAFVAAGVIVFTSLDVFIVWRNQSADRVMKTKDGQVLYQTSDYAVGTLQQGQTAVATVLRLSPDGGWSLEGSGPWLNPTQTEPFGRVAVIRNLSSGPINAYWLCAVEDNNALTSVQLYNVDTHQIEEQFDFHRGGIVEPVAIHTGTTLRLMSGEKVQLQIPIAESQIP